MSTDPPRRQPQEAQRQQAEHAREQAEARRQVAEEGRQVQEELRQTTEELRQTTENLRRAAEAHRQEPDYRLTLLADTLRYVTEVQAELLTKVAQLERQFISLGHRLTALEDEQRRR
jgi:hypothetical protein